MNFTTLYNEPRIYAYSLPEVGRLAGWHERCSSGCNVELGRFDKRIKIVYNMFQMSKQKRMLITDINELFNGRTLVSVQEAQGVGVSRALLSYWAKKGKIKRIAQGYYSLPGEIEDELVLISKRSSKIVFSHETALVLHRLHNRIPESPTVTIPTGSSVPRSISQNVFAYRIKPEWHSIGRTELSSFQGNAVPCYDLERTICDIIRSYSRMDVESYVGALKSYVERKDKDVSLLFEYARKMKIERKVHKVMEVLV